MLSEEPDLMAELDAAEDIVTGRVDKIETEWGVRYNAEGWVQSYGASDGGEAVARSAARDSENPNGPGVLVRRTVTYGPWEEAPGVPREVREEKGHD